MLELQNCVVLIFPGTVVSSCWNFRSHINTVNFDVDYIRGLVNEDLCSFQISKFDFDIPK